MEIVRWAAGAVTPAMVVSGLSGAVFTPVDRAFALASLAGTKEGGEDADRQRRVRDILRPVVPDAAATGRN